MSRQHPAKNGRPSRETTLHALRLLADGVAVKEVQAKSGITWPRLAEMLADPELERTLVVLRGPVAA